MLQDSPTFSSFSVDDVARAKEFYGQTLGLRVTETDMADVTLLGLHHPDGHETMVYPKPDHEPASFTVLNFRVADVERTVDALSERGVGFERYEGTEMETDERGVFRGGGPLIAWFKDPAGNVLSVIQQD